MEHIQALSVVCKQLIDRLELWRQMGSECARLEGEADCTECDGRLVESEEDEPSCCNECGAECECTDCYDLIVLRRAYATIAHAKNELESALRPPHKPSWEHAPEWANWLAMDKDGRWYWYEDKPTITRGTWTADGREQRARTPEWGTTLESRQAARVLGE